MPAQALSQVVPDLPKAVWEMFLLHAESNRTHQELSFFSTALFSAYLGATMTNMLSVVSSLLAKGLFHWTHFEAKHRVSEHNSAKGRAELGEGTQSAQGVVWFPLKHGTCSHYLLLLILWACTNFHRSALNSSEIITWLYFLPEVIEKRSLHMGNKASNLV